MNISPLVFYFQCILESLMIHNMTGIEMVFLFDKSNYFRKNGVWLWRAFLIVITLGKYFKLSHVIAFSKIPGSVGASEGDKYIDVRGAVMLRKVERKPWLIPLWSVVKMV